MNTICTLALVLAAIDPVILEDSIDHHWYVAVDGDDAATGTESAPFATVQRAHAAVRAALAEDSRQQILVEIGPGNFFVPEGLGFGPGDGSTGDFPVLYNGDSSYEGPTRLIGGVRVTDWQHMGNNVWQAPIPDEARPPNAEDDFPMQLFEDGWRMTLAREPNAGYFRTAGPAEGEARTAFHYRAKDMDPAGWDIRNARVAVWPGHDWFRHTKRLVELDPVRRLLRLSNKNGYPMRDEGDRYFVENVPELLDLPGECVFDWDSNTVSCIPRGDAPPTEREMIIPTADHVLSLAGKSAMQPVHDIRFSNLDFFGARSHGVVIAHGRNIRLERCHITNAGRSGIEITGTSQEIQVRRSTIAFNGGHGINMAGAGLADPPLHSDNCITDNRVHHNGDLIGHGYGIALNGTRENLISHNHIHHQPRYGITIKGTMFKGNTREVAGAVFAPSSAKALVHSRNNIIEGNRINHVNLDSQDTGAIESWGPGIGNIIRGNYIHDVGTGQFDLISGIYLDDSASFFTVERNVIEKIHGTSHSQAIYTKGVGNIIQNNIFILDDAEEQGIASFEMGNEPARAHHYNRNIHIFEGDARSIYQFDNWSDTRVASCDYNLYVMHGNQPLFEGIPGDETWANWRTLLDGKFDTHSRLTDNLEFKAPEWRDYTFAPDSPAAELGIEPVDLVFIGPGSTSEMDLRVPMVHTRLEALSEMTAWEDTEPGTFRLVATHVWGATWEGTLRLRVWPAKAGEIIGPDELPMRLLSGEERVEEFQVRAHPGHDFFIVAAHGDRPTVHTSTVPVEPNPGFRIRQLPQIDITEHGGPLLEQPSWTLSAGGMELAEVRMALSGESLAFHAQVRDASLVQAERLWEGSCIEIFGAMPGGKIGQVFLVPPTATEMAMVVPTASGDTHVPWIPLQVSNVEGGYELSALIPFSALYIDPAADRFLVEVAVNAMPEGARERKRAMLFGGHNAFQDSSGFGLAVVGE